MPTLVSRDEALARIRDEVTPGSCLMCAIRDDRAGDRWVIDEDDELILILPRYVRRWGQLLVVLKPHVTRYHEVDPRLWQRASAWALRAASIVEQAMSPVRCYITSTGSAAGELTQSSAHLHLHIIPVYATEDRPRDIFSWADGVWVADAGEWRALQSEYGARWREQPMRGSTPPR